MRKSSSQILHIPSRSASVNTTQLIIEKRLSPTLLNMNFSIESEILRKQQKEASRKQYDRVFDRRSSDVMDHYMSNLKPLPYLASPLKASPDASLGLAKHNSKNNSYIFPILGDLVKSRRKKAIHVKSVDDSPRAYLLKKLAEKSEKSETNNEHNQSNLFNLTRTESRGQIHRGRPSYLIQKLLPKGIVTPESSLSFRDITPTDEKNLENNNSARKQFIRIFARKSLHNEHDAVEHGSFSAREQKGELSVKKKIQRAKNYNQKTILDQLRSQATRFKGNISTSRAI